MRSSYFRWVIAASLPLIAISCGSEESGSQWAAGDQDGGYGASSGSAGNTGAAASSGQSGVGGQQIGTDGSATGCSGDCETDKTGAGTGNPFDPEGADDSSNVSVDDTGALVLDRAAANSAHLIWISNTAQNTVSKVDTTTYKELGRYRSGSGDPSRTSVNSIGDVYVGNRNGHSITKISAAGELCPDTNGDGVVKTSKGPADILAAGQDDCVLWETPLGGDIRGVAAEDIYKQVTVDPDLPPDIQEEHYVWAGGLHNKIYKLDGETGKVLMTIDSPCPVYGLALDGLGNLWMTRGNCVGRVDITKCVDEASCNVEVCASTCEASTNNQPAACTAKCDDAVKEKITIPDTTYGITVDFKHRVWLGGGTGLKRYDPQAPAATRFTKSTNPFSHGVAADANGWIWGAANPNLVRLNAETMEHKVINLTGSKGMAVDKDGKIWIITRAQSAHVVIPGQTINDNDVKADAVTGLVQPYTYSDMTGLQAALAKNDPGHYMQTFEGCAAGKETRWYELTWEASVPAQTSVYFRVRTADTKAALKTAKWVSAAVIPNAVPPVNLEQKFKAAGVKMGTYLDLDVWLSVDANEQSLVTPKVKSFSVTHSCPPSVQ